MRLSNAYKSILRHQRASTRARKRSSEQDATTFNSAELSRFTPANASNSANHLPVSRIKFAADRSCNYVRELAMDNQLVASGSLSRPQVDLTFERFRFLAPCQRLRAILRLREQWLRSEITSVSRVANVLLLRFVAGTWT